MWHDPIVDKIHIIREQHARKFNYNLKAIYDDLKQQEKNSDIQTVSLAVKRLQVDKSDS